MVKPMLSRPLSDDEIEELDKVLSHVEGGEIPTVEALDGFLTALVICPELVKPSEYFPALPPAITVQLIVCCLVLPRFDSASSSRLSRFSFECDGGFSS